MKNKFRWVQLGLIAGTSVFAILSGAATCHAADITVNTTADISGGNVCSLRNAMLSAFAPSLPHGNCTKGGSGANTIHVPSGTYNIGSQQLPSLYYVTIVGDPNHMPIINGNASVNSYPIFNVGAATKLQYLTLQNGKSTGYGGAIYVGEYAQFELANCIIKNNTAQSGGGVYLDLYGSANIHDSRITGNYASSGGGGVYSRTGLTVYLTTVDNNTTGGQAGGIYTDGTASIVESTIAFNNGNSWGGGIWVNSSPPNLYIGGSTVAYNKLTNPAPNYGNSGSAGVMSTYSSGYVILERNALVGNTWQGNSSDCRGYFSSDYYNYVTTAVSTDPNSTGCRWDYVGPNDFVAPGGSTGLAAAFDSQGGPAPVGMPFFTPTSYGPLVDKASHQSQTDQDGYSYGYLAYGDNAATPDDIGAIERRFR